MSNIDRDFATYLAFTSQLGWFGENEDDTLTEIGEGVGTNEGTDASDLSFADNDQLFDPFIAAHPNTSLETLITLKLDQPPTDEEEDEDDGDEEENLNNHQVRLYWGTVRNALPQPTMDERDTTGIDKDRILISVIDDTQDIVCGHSSQFEATITLILSYRLGIDPADARRGEDEEPLTVDEEHALENFNRRLARAWAAKIEAFFPYKRVIEDFPPASPDVYVPIMRRANLHLEDEVDTRFDFCRRDSHFVRAYPLPGGGGAIPSDGRTYEILTLTVAGGTINPVHFSRDFEE